MSFQILWYGVFLFKLFLSRPPNRVIEVGVELDIPFYGFVST